MEIAEHSRNKNVYKPKNEGIGGRSKDGYLLLDLANMILPVDAKDGSYATMSILSMSPFDMNSVSTPEPIKGFPKGNSPELYELILAMREEGIHPNHNVDKVALFNKNTGRVELITRTNCLKADLEGPGRVVQTYNPEWFIWKQASLQADITFWKTLQVCCQNRMRN
jgi:hypothetical protein